MRINAILCVDGLLVPITDAMGADAETVRLVTQISAHNDVLVVFVFDPMEAALPSIDRTIMASAGQQVEIETSDSRLRGRFAANVAERRTSIEGFSRRRAIPVLPVSTARDVLGQFRELLGPPIHQDRPARDLLLLVDLSASMDTQDFSDTTGTKAPSRGGDTGAG